MLVIDLGGGTFDCSLVEAFEGCLEVLSIGGDSLLVLPKLSSQMKFVLQGNTPNKANCRLNH